MPKKGDSIKVLMVDDEEEVRRLLAKLLRDTWPLKIFEAEDGLEALNLLLNNAPDLDLIILDMMMPKLSGPEVLKIIRCRPDFDRVPIIACTAVNESGFIQKIIRYGVMDYLVKPIDRIEFIKKIFHVFNTAK